MAGLKEFYSFRKNILLSYIRNKNVVKFREIYNYDLIELLNYYIKENIDPVNRKICEEYIIDFKNLNEERKEEENVFFRLRANDPDIEEEIHQIVDESLFQEFYDTLKTKKNSWNHRFKFQNMMQDGHYSVICNLYPLIDRNDLEKCLIFKLPEMVNFEGIKRCIDFLEKQKLNDNEIRNLFLSCLKDYNLVRYMIIKFYPGKKYLDLIEKIKYFFDNIEAGYFTDEREVKTIINLLNDYPDLLLTSRMIITCYKCNNIIDYFIQKCSKKQIIEYFEKKLNDFDIINDPEPDFSYIVRKCEHTNFKIKKIPCSFDDICSLCNENDNCGYSICDKHNFHRPCLDKTFFRCNVCECEKK